MRQPRMPLREANDPLIRSRNIPICVSAVLEVEPTAVADVALDADHDAAWCFGPEDGLLGIET